MYVCMCMYIFSWWCLLYVHRSFCIHAEDDAWQVCTMSLRAWEAWTMFLSTLTCFKNFEYNKLWENKDRSAFAGGTTCIFWSGYDFSIGLYPFVQTLFLLYVFFFGFLITIGIDYLFLMWIIYIYTKYKILCSNTSRICLWGSCFKFKLYIYIILLRQEKYYFVEIGVNQIQNFSLPNIFPTIKTKWKQTQYMWMWFASPMSPF